MPESFKPITQACIGCSRLIDITDEEPLGLMHCPMCDAAMRVRRSFGRFEPVEVLGAGGMGAVYRAFDSTLNRSVALKLLRREYSQHPEITAQFEREAAVTAHINHPNVVKVYSSGTDHGTFYIAMELVDKGSLDELMTQLGKIGEAQVLAIGIQIAQGLRAAYRQGLIHRDVKPGNILFSDARTTKIVDFGLASSIDDTQHVAGEIWGTPYYVAPEKLEHPPLEDFRSDIYSLGATLFHALAGKPPYEAEDASINALRALKSQPVSLASFAPEISTRTALVINRTLLKEPNQRQTSYDELIEQLEYARAELHAANAKKKRPGTRVVMEDRGSQRALTLVALAILLILGVGGYFLYEHRDKLFPRRKLETVLPGTRAPLPDQAMARYDEARQLLLAAKFAEAAAAFHHLGNDPKTARPLQDWATLHAGLAQLFAGQLDEARKEFTHLAALEHISNEPEDEKLTAFFQKIAAAVQRDTGEEPAKIEEYNPRNYESIALLICGLKDWEIGEFESSLKTLDDFRFIAPEGGDEWILEYRPLSAPYEQIFESYRGFNELVKALNDPVKAKPELPKVREMLASLNLKGALARKGRSTVRRLEQEIADFESEQASIAAEMDATDDKTLVEAENAVKPLVATFKFDLARDSVGKAATLTEKGKKKRKGLVDKYEWLATFKSQLSQDLGTAPFPTGLLKKNGLKVPGAVADATDAAVVVRTAGGNISVPWEEVSFDSIIAMAQAYCRADLPTDRLGDRYWVLGVFAATQSQFTEAQKFFRQALEKKPAYKKDLVIFPDVPPV